MTNSLGNLSNWMAARNAVIDRYNERGLVPYLPEIKAIAVANGCAENDAHELYCALEQYVKMNNARSAVRLMLIDEMPFDAALLAVKDFYKLTPAEVAEVSRSYESQE